MLTSFVLQTYTLDVAKKQESPTTFRPDDDDRRIMAKIVRHLTASVGEPSVTLVIRFALRAADRELARKQ